MEAQTIAIASSIASTLLCAGAVGVVRAMLNMRTEITRHEERIAPLEDAASKLGESHGTIRESLASMQADIKWIREALRGGSVKSEGK